MALSVWRLGKWPGDPNVAKLAAFLLPVNFVLFAALKERGVLSIDGFLKVALIATQAVGVAWFADHNVVADFLRLGDRPGAWLWLPLAAEASFVAATIALLALVFMRRTKVEQGLLWALVAVFLGLYEIDKPQALLFYFGAAGLVLVLAVLEHGYRDRVPRRADGPAGTSGVHQRDRAARRDVRDRDVRRRSLQAIQRHLRTRRR